MRKKKKTIFPKKTFKCDGRSTEGWSRVLECSCFFWPSGFSQTHISHYAAHHYEDGLLRRLCNQSDPSGPRIRIFAVKYKLSVASPPAYSSAHSCSLTPALMSPHNCTAKLKRIQVIDTSKWSIKVNHQNSCFRLFRTRWCRHQVANEFQYQSLVLTRAGLIKSI